MAGWQNITRLWQWCLLCALLIHMPIETNGGASSCQPKERFLMLVSTLDGRVTALEVGTGNPEWSVDTGSKALLSSSISSYEMVRDGLPVRLIPSLDGSLYQYDGSGIEPVPLAANLLLSNSFRFSDDSTVVGGEEVETYGVDIDNGQLRYVCSIVGCRFFPTNNNDDDDKEPSDTLVVTRRTKTVRTVHMQTGSEKWNFSVGQHEVSFIKSQRPEMGAEGHRDRRNTVTGREETEHCSVEEEEEGFFDGFDFHWFTSEEAGTHYSPSDLQVKVIVPSGIVVAVLKDNPAQVVWQQKFEAAIANAWLLQGEDLLEVNLFDNQNIPALSMGNPDTIPGENNEEDVDSNDESQAMLYVGVYENQVYVQPSYRMMQDVHDATTRAVVTGDTRAINMPRVHWKPYLATAVSRTPIVVPKKVESAPKKLGLSADTQTDTDNGSDDNSVAQYPFDEGVYLLQDYTPMPLGEDRQIEDRSTYHHDMSYLAFIFARGPELFAIICVTVVISLVVHLALMKYFHGNKSAETSSSSQQSETIEPNTSSSNADLTAVSKEASSAELTEYSSRFYTDFEQTAVLGRGGFGVVFESRNRLDDCIYAIKRIALNKSDRAKEKVMREVKALAKLEHMGIVRYHQAWFENPPAGWQEEQDKTMKDIPSLSPGFSVTELSPSPAESFREDAPFRRLSQLYLCNMDKDHKFKDIHNPLKPFQEESLSFGVRTEVDDESWASDKEMQIDEPGSRIKKVGSSGEFIPHSASFEIGVPSDNDDTDTDEGGSFSFSFSHSPPKGHWGNEDSFEVVFNGEDNVSQEKRIDSSGSGLPFSVYSIDSSKTDTLDTEHTDTDTVDIVFEDSGCGERASEDGVPPLPAHSVINISSQSQSTAHRSKSFSPLPHILLDCIKEDETLSSRTPSKHKKSASLDLNSQASRPIDLPLSTNDACQATSQPVAKLYLYIQMQLCKRESLNDWLASNTRIRDRLLVLDIFHQIVTAMDYVHDMGLMHRDLKPSNIFFSMDGLVKIGDFGLVTALEETCGSPYEGQITPMNQKHTGQVGTKLYMSPEQNEGKHYTQKVDIYALGLIFFELFNSFDTQMERLRTMMDAKRHHFPDMFNRMLSSEETKFVKLLLSHDPEHRPGTKQILAQKMFTPFEEIQKAFMNHRARSGSRIRTYSTSSNHSGSGSGSQSSPDTVEPLVRFY